jgi:Ca2+-binding EF-hand superfamily protein
LILSELSVRVTSRLSDQPTAGTAPHPPPSPLDSMSSWLLCACATDDAEVDARFADRRARKYVAKLTPKEQLVYREIAGFPPLVALRATFQRADSRARGTIDGDEFLSLLGIHRDAYAERLLELFDVDSDGEISLFEFIVGLARFETRRDDDRVAFDYVAFAFALFDVDGGGSVDARELSALVVACHNARLAARRAASRWNDGAKDPVVADLRRFRERLAHDYPSSLDDEAFRRLAGQYPRLLEPAYDAWSKLEVFAHPAAVVAANLARRGHREFDVRRNTFAVAAAARRRRVGGGTRGRRNPAARGGVRSMASPGGIRAGSDERSSSERSDEDASDSEYTSDASPTMTPRLVAEVRRKNDAYDRALRTDGNVVATALFGAKNAERMAAERRRALAAREARRDEEASSEATPEELARARARFAEKTRVAEMDRAARAAGMPTLAELEDAQRADAAAPARAPKLRYREGSFTDEEASRANAAARRAGMPTLERFAQSARRLGAVVARATSSRRSFRSDGRSNPPTRARAGWDEDPDATYDNRVSWKVNVGAGAGPRGSLGGGARGALRAASRRVGMGLRAVGLSRARRSEAPLSPEEDARLSRRAPRGRAARQ